MPTAWGRGVAVLDIDAFALVNHGYGPDAADRVLQQLAGRLQLLGGRHALGRWQADEFVFIVDATDPVEVLEAFLEALPAVTQPSFQVGPERVRLSLSCGLAVNGTVPTAELFRSAMAALGAAKARGRDRAEWFDPAAHQVASGCSLRLAHDLDRGIAAGELRLHLQPIVELSTNDVTGAEALVRWERPGVGLLEPAAFIEVAERSGQIISLGAWVARQACLAAVELAELTDAPLRVSINVSARQLTDPGLVHMLRQVLAETGCPPGHLAIEVTETALLDDLDAATVVLEDIKALGLWLDLDDFGTGYSSLLHLKHFPVDRIKIDQSFIQGLGTNATDTAIVASLIALAHNVGLTAVAEGVMNAQQLRELRQMDCDFAQGYLLSRPVTLGELHTWLAQHVPSRLLPRQGSRTQDQVLLVQMTNRVIDIRDRASGPAAAGGHALDPKSAKVSPARAGEAVGDSAGPTARALANHAAFLRASRHAVLDALTGGYLQHIGVAALDDLIGQARRTRQPLAVASVEVADLRATIDRAGQTGGDSLLVALANALGGILRPTDLLIRHGSARLVCAFPDRTASAVAPELAAARALMSGPPLLGRVIYRVADLRPGEEAEQLISRTCRQSTGLDGADRLNA